MKFKSVLLVILLVTVVPGGCTSCGHHRAGPEPSQEVIDKYEEYRRFEKAEAESPDRKDPSKELRDEWKEWQAEREAKLKR